jgi:hypothetical protein
MPLPIEIRVMSDGLLNIENPPFAAIRTPLLRYPFMNTSQPSSGEEKQKWGQPTIYLFQNTGCSFPDLKKIQVTFRSVLSQYDFYVCEMGYIGTDLPFETAAKIGRSRFTLEDKKA